MNASNLLCLELLPTYDDFKPLNKSKVKGYKLCRKVNGNHYSLVTGLFRYKARNIVQNSYSGLYEKEKEHYNEHLKDRVSVFVNKQDAIDALSGIVDFLDHKVELCLIEITIMGENLETAKFTNRFVDGVNVYVGPIMDKIVELETNL